MERHFILPLTIAAAVHVGLLFGIPGAPAEPPRERDKNPVEKTPPPIFVIIPVAPEAEDTVKPVGHPEAPPSIPEPPPTERPDSPSIEIPPHEAVPIPAIHTIPIGPIGDPNGSIDGKPHVGSDILRSVDLDAPPRARLQVAPVYPFDAKNTGREGEVLVEFTVDESGVVVAPRVLRSSDRSFEEPTLRAVSRWRFEPGRRAGKIVRFRMSVPVVFNLNEN